MCGPTNSHSIQNSVTKKRVAIIGSGVDALLVGWYLDKTNQCEVSIFSDGEERNNAEKKDTVDTDVCLFNAHSSPTLCSVLEELNVAHSGTIGKDIFLSHSFNVRTTDYDDPLSWETSSESKLDAQKCCFGKEVEKFLLDLTCILKYTPDDPRRAVSIIEFVQSGGYNDTFLSGFLLPLLGGDENSLLRTTANQTLHLLWELGLLKGKVLENKESPSQYKILSLRSLKSKLQELLKTNIQSSIKIESMKKVPSKSADSSTKFSYELFSTSHNSIGVFEEVVFSTSSVGKATSLCDTVESRKVFASFLADMKQNTKTTELYYHTDKTLLTSGGESTFHWLSETAQITMHSNQTDGTKHKGESMEGGESGFGNQAIDKHDNDRYNSFLTYDLKEIVGSDIFLSLNPITPPNPNTVFAHETITHASSCKEERGSDGDGLWFIQGNDERHESGGTDFLFRCEKECADAKLVAHRISKTLPDEADNPVQKPDPIAESSSSTSSPKFGFIGNLYRTLSYDLPVQICKRMIISFLRGAITKGLLQFKFNDGSVISIGSPVDDDNKGVDSCPVVIRVFEDWFFVKTALEYDLGMARSYMAGYFTVEALSSPTNYDPTLLWPAKTAYETTSVLGDPIGLTRLFLLFINNRDSTVSTDVVASANAHSVRNAFSNASGLFVARVGSLFNYIRYKLTMDNSEKGGSLKNIHAHYDLSNDLFRTFLDPETLMYSSAIYNGVTNPTTKELTYKGTLEEAQWRKLDTLLARAQMTDGLAVLDIGFGWGGLSLRAARKYNARVHGITLSVEQMALATERVKKEGLEHLITFEVIDYRTFSRKKENQGRFDRVLSCEMIEAVGHEHLGEFYESVERVLKRDGILVMEAITTPEERYETYIRTTDFINTIIFPGSCCPSLHALVDAAYKNSTLTLEHVSNIGLHYARTLAEWRRRFNENEIKVRRIGFDSVFLRVWNYYLTYCEAAFYSRTENCLILVFARPGCNALAALAESREICQEDSLTLEEANQWLTEG